MNVKLACLVVLGSLNCETSNFLIFYLVLILCSELGRCITFVNLCISHVSVECRCQSINTDKKKSSRNILDNASNLLTDLLSGGSIGSMPIAEGAVSDLFNRPLFFSLYDWFLEVLTLLSIMNFSCPTLHKLYMYLGLSFLFSSLYVFISIFDF